MPGRVTYFWFIPTRTGTFDVPCFELCGTGHYTMRGTVVVEKESAYQAWLQEQPTFAQSLAEAATGTGNAVKLVLNEREADSSETGSAR